jgi:hypothetical protein
VRRGKPALDFDYSNAAFDRILLGQEAFHDLLVALVAYRSYQFAPRCSPSSRCRRSATPRIPVSTARPVTFSKDVAPILQDKCQQCHQPNSIAPMSLITYEDARPWARSMKQRVVTRQMPPWHIDPSVGVHEFKNDMSLTDAQIDTSFAGLLRARLRATRRTCRRRSRS